MKIEKQQDWHNRLHDFVNIQRGIEFKWGESDCLYFAAGCVRAMTGVDVLEGIKYDSPEKALRLLAKGATVKGVKHKGPKTPAGIWTHFFGESKHPNFAHIGDLVTFGEGEFSGRNLTTEQDVTFSNLGGIPTTGVVAFSGSTVMLRGSNGLIMASLFDCDSAWEPVSRGDA